LRHALESENFEVIFAVDGNEALEKFYDGYLDVVLLDLKMPGKSGWEVFERMTAVNPLLPIIIITASNGAVELLAQAGVSAIMEKPLELPTLLWAIHRLLREPLERRLWRIAAHCPLIMVSES
jgi:CheY-like chemotaxis protein